ncbi:MAG TPA: hypothetical protein VHI95_10925 [Acidimicrobiales bacterium]|nr:hypothetical protein [Acidimicrobiales bacterium]
MSDTSRGEGWWQASDGKWYPPEQHPDVRRPTEPVEEAGTPTGATPPTTTAMPPVSPGPPTQAFPPPFGPPGGPPPGPPTGPPLGTTAGSNKKWIIPVAAAAAIVIAVVAFLLLRNDDDDDNVSTATDNSDQSSDSTSSSKSSSSKSSSSKSSSSTSAEFVDPNGVEDRLLTASDIGSEFTDGTFTPSDETVDLCGNPNARAVVPPTQVVGSASNEASQDLHFEEEVIFHRTAADNREAFDLALDSLRTCTEGALPDGTPFTVSSPEDVSSQVGASAAVEATVQAGDTTVIVVGVRLDNCVASFTFQFPTSGAEPDDELGIVEDGIDRLLS